MDKLYYLWHKTTHAIMKSSTSLNDGDFPRFTEYDLDADDLSFDTSGDDDNDNNNNNDDDDANDDDVNDNIEEEKVTSEYDDEVDKYVDVSVNSDSWNIDGSLEGRVLRAWLRRKSTMESNSFHFRLGSLRSSINNGWVKRIMNGKQRNKIVALVRNLYADQEDEDVSKWNDIFWNEYN